MICMTYYVNVDSSVVTNVPLSWGILIMGEAMHIWEEGGTGNLSTFHSTLLKPHIALKIKFINYFINCQLLILKSNVKMKIWYIKKKFQNKSNLKMSY